ncbi:outer membrane beta-barrel protein [Pelagicoccus sp. NFK12]|uniref:Outer membrane beta-barrel protein n=1 Tax=Pelagicoccus enzymogenes TaxID=2773457 RepID=A0A927FBH1_9BACT|nr:porin [Pelagicoccus enzymogenes]MBD5781794.1 outer membrane beta-barrel protein [Pelagicoccus enzymogenes]MDQ8196550.1 porin [Pelagicoccus enzymogenes]
MNKLLSVTAAGALLSSSALYGQIEINDNLSVTGFLDMSLFHADTDDGDSTSFDLDQMELDFLFSFDEITGQVDLDYQRGDANEIDLEQAFITYDLGEGTSITAGKFLSYMGWETAEPTGLYQYSYAYGTTIPGYHNGVTIDFSDDWGSLGLALVDSVYDDDGSINNDADDFDMGIETKLVLTPADGWTFFLGYAIDSANAGMEDRELINFWSSYEVGSSTFAFEYNDYSDGWTEIDQWLLMYSVAVGDKGTFTARASANDVREGTSLDNQDFKKYTAAYIHAVNDNLAIVSEVSQVDYWSGDATEFALEALFTF